MTKQSIKKMRSAELREHLHKRITLSINVSMRCFLSSIYFFDNLVTTILYLNQSIHFIMRLIPLSAQSLKNSVGQRSV